MGKVWILASVLTALGGIWWWATTRPPRVIGVREGHLHPCPPSPNCVCSEFQGEGSISPFILVSDKDPLDALEKILRQDSSVTVINRSRHYLHAEFRTPWIRFIDDVEARLDPEAGVLHLRSASRVGYSDLGTNRRRIEELKRKLEFALSPG